MLEFDGGDKVLAKTTYMENTKCFDTDEIDIDKRRVSDKYFYKKEDQSYKYCVFYEHNGKHIPLKILLIDVVGYYKEYKSTEYTAKIINFKPDANLMDKVYDVFLNIAIKKILVLANMHIKVVLLAMNILKRLCLMEHCLKMTTLA